FPQFSSSLISGVGRRGHLIGCAVLPGALTPFALVAGKRAFRELLISHKFFQRPRVAVFAEAGAFVINGDLPHFTGAAVVTAVNIPPQNKASADSRAEGNR